MHGTHTHFLVSITNQLVRIVRGLETMDTDYKIRADYSLISSAEQENNQLYFLKSCVKTNAGE